MYRSAFTAYSADVFVACVFFRSLLCVIDVLLSIDRSIDRARRAESLQNVNTFFRGEEEEKISIFSKRETGDKHEAVPRSDGSE